MRPAVAGQDFVPRYNAEEWHSPKAPPEAEYYKIITIPTPEGVELECGGMENLPGGKLAVSTRKGDIYVVENANDDPPDKVKFTKWATGMHEVMGLAYNAKDGFLYAVQRGEITRLKDSDGRGRANVYETYCDDWGIGGDYHEYPWMSKFDKDGNLFVLLCLTGSFTSEIDYRGWCLKVTPDGKSHPYASGIRSPGGIGFDDKGNLFFTDNQGPWNGTSSLKHITQGSFQGNPQGNKWYELPKVKAELGEHRANRRRSAASGWRRGRSRSLYPLLPCCRTSGSARAPAGSSATRAPASSGRTPIRCSSATSTTATSAAWRWRR